MVVSNFNNACFNLKIRNFHEKLIILLLMGYLALNGADFDVLADQRLSL